MKKRVVDKENWIPKPGDKVRFVDAETLDAWDMNGWYPKEGNDYTVKSFGDECYKSISLEECPEEKDSPYDGYQFRLSGFEPA